MNRTPEDIKKKAIRLLHHAPATKLSFELNHITIKKTYYKSISALKEQ